MGGNYLYRPPTCYVAEWCKAGQSSGGGRNLLLIGPMPHVKACKGIGFVKKEGAVFEVQFLACQASIYTHQDIGVSLRKVSSILWRSRQPGTAPVLRRRRRRSILQRSRPKTDS